MSALLLGSSALAGAWAYGSAVFLIDEDFGYFQFGPAAWYASIVLALIMFYRALAVLVGCRWTSIGTVQNLALVTISLTLATVLVDTVHAVYLNSKSKDPINAARQTDRNTWIGEIYPKLYYVTEKNFRLHKPGVLVTASHYGHFYLPSMLHSATLTDQVLENRTITISINERGFRESRPMKGVDTLILGDSFTFGWGVDEDLAWPQLLESNSNRAVYNLGVSDASPRQEVDLLEFVFRSYTEDLARVNSVLWMIYEGNDLEDDYAEARPGEARTGKLSQGTVIGLAMELPRIIRTQSIIWKLRSRQILLPMPVDSQSTGVDYIDGVSLQNPLYRSPVLGARLFYRPYLQLAQKDEGYVLRHPNREKLDATIRQMASLAAEFDFEVTVLLAPTAARLHGSFFQGFPSISPRPYFLDYVGEQSKLSGFRVIDLSRVLQPYAGSELLYFRDDDHFNERGHRAVADMISEIMADHWTDRQL